jgi:organic hydroperoxide reductase OsmC/OhrA
MTAPFPHRHQVDLAWEGDMGATVHGPAGGNLVGGPPPEFDGRADWWSAEQLLLSSVALCLLDTFLAFARRRGLVLRGYRGGARGTLEKTHDGLAFTSIGVDVELRVTESDAPLAERLLREARDQCIVANAIRVAIELNLTINGVTAGAIAASN